MKEKKEEGRRKKKERRGSEGTRSELKWRERKGTKKKVCMCVCERER